VSTRNGVEPHVIGILDDDHAVREAVGNLLESSGFQVESFGSVKEFFDSYRRKGISCLILDVRLPGSTGLALQASLLKQPKRIPVIIITAHADEDVRKQALGAGAVAFFYKPFRAEALLSAIRTALHQPES